MKTVLAAYWSQILIGLLIIIGIVYFFNGCNNQNKQGGGITTESLVSGRENAYTKLTEAADEVARTEQDRDVAFKAAENLTDYNAKKHGAKSGDVSDKGQTSQGSTPCIDCPDSDEETLAQIEALQKKAETKSKIQEGLDRLSGKSSSNTSVSRSSSSVRRGSNTTRVVEKHYYHKDSNPRPCNTCPPGTVPGPRINNNVDSPAPAPVVSERPVKWCVPNLLDPSKKKCFDSKAERDAWAKERNIIVTDH